MTSRPPTGVSVVPPPRGRTLVARPAPSPSAPPVATRNDVALPELALALLVAAVFLVPIAVGTVAWSAPGGGDDFNRRITFQLFDLGLVLVGCARIAVLLPRITWGDAFGAVRRRAVASALSLAITVLGVAGVVAVAVHPSPRGVELAARIGLGALAAQAIITAPVRWLVRIQGAIAIMASAQAVLAIAQSANGAPLGLRWLEFDGPLYPFGSSFAGRGGLTHPYHLAVVLEVGLATAILAVRHARRPLPWFVAIAACSAGLGVTYSRAAAIGVAAAVVALLVPVRREHDVAVTRVYRLAAAVMLVGVAATAFTMGDGWHARTSTSTSISAADSGRLDRAREAIDLVGDEPIVGVGPGRYVIALAERGDNAPLPAHDIVLHVAAEAGALAGVAMAAVALLLARRYVTASRESAAAFLLLVPYFVFDAYPYVFPVGLFMTALWIGLLERARSA